MTMENRTEDYKNIPGWGIDADPKNDPTYPIKKRTDEEHKGYTWEWPPQQPIDIEVLHSNDAQTLPPCLGHLCHPRG